MPEQISSADFIREAWEDFNSPTTSSFVPRMGKCKNTVAAIEETLDSDRSGLTKMKKSVKALYSSGTMHVSNEAYLAENLEKLGINALNRDNVADIGEAFLKFAVVTKELSALMKNLMQNLNNILMFPLDSFVKGDLKGIKGDMKKPFDKACKDYDSKFNKIEKEKKQLAKEAGMLRSEVMGTEVAEEMEKERKMFQLQMCEYLIKVNEIKTKKGVDLLQHLVEYYQAQNNYFQDGMKTIEHFRCYIEELVKQLNIHRQQQDAERRKLIELRDQLKSTMSVYKENSSVSSGYSLHQLQGNKLHGCEKSGSLLKKSEGVRKVWQKRQCRIKDGYLSISHHDISKEPVKLNLLTCQVKLVHEDAGKKCFDLISSSKNRTYHFQADDTKDMEEWISVLNNAKEAVFRNAFAESAGQDCSPMNQSVKELTRTIMSEIKRLPGNKNCCDCNAPDPEWLSVNLGVFICLECCGIHRDMGVHISRTQSIVIDHIGTSQLLLARVVSNRMFNEIMEATLDPQLKPTPNSDMEKRKAFIRAKYEKHRYAIVTCNNIEDRKQDLRQAILSRDIFALLQVFAEGIDFMEPLPDMENDESSLHLAIDQEDDVSSLHLVDFILQNSNSQKLDRTTKDGDTVLHLCARSNKTECMKLLLRVQPELTDIENAEGETALDIARSMGYDLCSDLLLHAVSGKTELFENVNIDWNLMCDDHLYEPIDYSDDDLEGIQTPDSKRARSRPGSIVNIAGDLPMFQPIKSQRDHSTESLRSSQSSIPPPPPKPAKYDSATLPNPGKPTSKSNQDCTTLPYNKTKVVVGNNIYATIAPLQPGSTATLPRKKAPAPPPPGLGHTRNPSDPFPPKDKCHVRSPSDPRPPTEPPPLPLKPATLRHNPMPGAKLVLPPPPSVFRDTELLKKKKVPTATLR